MKNAGALRKYSSETGGALTINKKSMETSNINRNSYLAIIGVCFVLLAGFAIQAIMGAVGREKLTAVPSLSAVPSPSTHVYADPVTPTSVKTSAGVCKVSISTHLVLIATENGILKADVMARQDIKQHCDTIGLGKRCLVFNICEK